MAAGFVGELPAKISVFQKRPSHKQKSKGIVPSENRGLVLVPVDPDGDVVLERLDDARIGEEEIVVARVEDLLDVDVHSTVVLPVVRKGDDELETMTVTMFSSVTLIQVRGGEHVTHALAEAIT